MGFEDQIKAITEKAKEAMEAKKSEVENNAKSVLYGLLGDEVS